MKKCVEIQLLTPKLEKTLHLPLFYFHSLSKENQLKRLLFSHRMAGIQEPLL